MVQERSRSSSVENSTLVKLEHSNKKEEKNRKVCEMRAVRKSERKCSMIDRQPSLGHGRQWNLRRSEYGISERGGDARGEKVNQKKQKKTFN